MGPTAGKNLSLIALRPNTSKHKVDGGRALLYSGLGSIQNQNGPGCSRAQSQSFYDCAFIRGSFVIENLALFPSFMRGARSDYFQRTLEVGFIGTPSSFHGDFCIVRLCIEDDDVSVGL